MLHHAIDAYPYVEQQKRELRVRFPSKGERALMQEHNCTFIEWFHDHVMSELLEKDHKISDTVK